MPLGPQEHPASYRKPAPTPDETHWPIAERGKLVRLLCGFAGHRFAVLRVTTRKHLGLLHHHPLAGTDAQCTRCGERWRDAGGGWGRDRTHNTPVLLPLCDECAHPVEEP
jgi:hypothetical protein